MNLLKKEGVYFKTHLINRKLSKKSSLPLIENSFNKKKGKKPKTPFLVPYYPRKRKLKKTKSTSLHIQRDFLEVLKENQKRHHERRKRTFFKSCSKSQLLPKIEREKRKRNLECLPMKPYKRGTWENIQGLKIRSIKEDSRFSNEEEMHEVRKSIIEGGLASKNSFLNVEAKTRDFRSSEVQIFLPKPSGRQVEPGESFVKREIMMEQKDIK